MVGIVLLTGGLYAGGRFLLAQSYYISLDDDQVAIFQGIDAELGPISLSWVSERSELTVEDVAPYYRPTLEEGFAAADINDARRLVRGIPQREDPSTDEPTTDETAGTPSGGGSTEAADDGTS